MQSELESIFREYAFRFVGLPYRWGGDDSIDGFDCSGLALEILASFGIKFKTDMTADSLYRHFCKIENGAVPTLPVCGALSFFGSVTRVTHIGVCIGNGLMIEAGAGGSTTTTRDMAAKQNAYIRLRPVKARKDFVGCILPDYSKSGLIIA